MSPTTHLRPYLAMVTVVAIGIGKIAFIHTYTDWLDREPTDLCPENPDLTCIAEPISLWPLAITASPILIVFIGWAAYTRWVMGP